MPAPVTVRDAADHGTQPRSGLLIGVLVVSAFVMILNETILSVALRALTADLHVATTTIQWLTSGFLLTMAVVIPTTGFLLERFTPRQVFLASLTAFSVGTLIDGLAPGFGVLLVGRVVQAVGAFTAEVALAQALAADRVRPGRTRRSPRHPGCDARPGRRRVRTDRPRLQNRECAGSDIASVVADPRRRGD